MVDNFNKSKNSTIVSSCQDYRLYAPEGRKRKGTFSARIYPQLFYELKIGNKGNKKWPKNHIKEKLYILTPFSLSTLLHSR